MSFFRWGNRYDIGVPHMNDEHKVIIALMNRLWEQNAQRTSKSELQATLDKLVAFTDHHFEQEETYMESINYPGIGPHKNIHTQIMTRLFAFQQRYRKQRHAHLPGEFFDFLKTWLSAHIQHLDRQYANTASTKQRQRPVETSD